MRRSAAAIVDGPAVDRHADGLGRGVDCRDATDVAVVDLAVIVVLDLHHLVADAELDPATLDLLTRFGVEAGLQCPIELAGAHDAAVCRAEHLDLRHGVEAKALRNALGDKLDHLDDGVLGRRGTDAKEVLRSFAIVSELRRLAPVDPVRVADDGALGRLAEDLGQADHRHHVGLDEIGENQARAHRGKLIHVADEHERRGCRGGQRAMPA